MAENLKSLNLVCVCLLLASSLIVITEDRPYLVEDGEKFTSGSLSKGFEGTLEGLNARGMKTGGPSYRGMGHCSTNSRNLRVTFMSGPSPGVGH